MKRNKFNLSYTKLFSANMGDLIPIGLIEVLPGDSFQISTSMLLRCAPMLAPVMHPVDVRIHHWFVPHRLVWSHWEQFITGGPDGNDATPFPTTILPGATQVTVVGGLADYYGIPPGLQGTGTAFSALPFRGYALIWNEYYRDQDLQLPLNVDKDADGQVNAELSNIRLQKVCWEKDYFTSARPWEQKGPAVTLPLGTTAPVTGLGVAGTIATGTAAVVRETAPLPNRAYAFTANGWGTAAGAQMEVDSSAGATAKPKVFADLSNASSVTVNTLRQALALQRFEEARARYGSRYSEYLLSLGVRSSDARLQRPEYLGGGRQTIQFSEIMQTGPSKQLSDTVSAAGVQDVVGSLKGHGISAMRSNRFRRFFEEHGYIHSFLSVRPKTIYNDGIPRTWLRTTKTDFWQKELEHIGQQAVAKREVLARSNAGAIFGYQDRYDDYRRQESNVAGNFRSISAGAPAFTTLDYWHFSRSFATSVDATLNASFVACNPSRRPFAVQSASEPQLYCHARHSVLARRLVSALGTSMTF